MLKRVARLLGDELAIQARDADEIRVRLGRPIELRQAGASRLSGEAVTRETLARWVEELTQYSVYAWEPQMREGYFTLPDGCRVGVSGVFAPRPDGVWAIRHITSLSLRVSRAVRGAAAALMPHILDADGARSTLILSRPGLGKTTILRDAVRALSEAGQTVAVCDERGEISGMIDGAPCMDLGPRTDISVGCPRAADIARLLRAMAPDVIATDELGHPDDAQALGEAARAGVRILATAHAASFEDARHRRALGRLLAEGLFTRVAELRSPPGQIARILDGDGHIVWPA